MLQTRLSNTSNSNSSSGSWASRGRTLMEHFRETFSARPETPPQSVWYSGLVIEPTEFSGQLASLQLSLQGANSAARRSLLEPVQEPVRQPMPGRAT